ncbi:MAG: PQQ-binding-like beta-propeller repeat protein [Acidobacteriota bacterium]
MKTSTRLRVPGPVCILLAALGAVLGAFPAAADWPGILGVDRNGQTATPLPSELPEDPQVLWRAGVGEGMSGVVVAGGRVLVFHRPGSVERLEAFDVKNGTSLWQRDSPATYRGGILPDSGPRAVPTVAGDAVVTFGAGGRLAASALKDGAERWSVETAAVYGAPEGYFGFGSSPLVVDVGERQLVVAAVGGEVEGGAAGVVAFDLANGAEVWRSVDDRASYSSPVVASLGGRDQVVVATRLRVVGLDPKSGDVIWTVPFGRRGPSAVGALPVTSGGRLVITAAYGVGAKLLDFSKPEPEVVWSGDQLSSHYPTPAVIGGTIYGADGREDHGTGRLRAVDLATGEVRWTEKSLGLAHLLHDGERLLAVRIDGTLDLIAPSPERFRRLGSAKVSRETTRAVPAYVNGVLLVRTTPSRGGGEVLAVKLR